MIYLFKKYDSPIKNYDWPIKNDDLPFKNDDLPIKNDDLPIKNDDFPHGIYLLLLFPYVSLWPKKRRRDARPASCPALEA